MGWSVSVGLLNPQSCTNQLPLQAALCYMSTGGASLMVGTLDHPLDLIPVNFGVN